MNRIFSTLVGIIWLTAAAAQDKYEISKPLNLPERGVNKVLCMKNGNTVLLHLDILKPITVKIFDSTHKLTGTKELHTRLLNTSLLQTTSFKGLFEINNEAVLFVEQDHLSKRQLIRIRFNGKSGTLVQEEEVAQSPGIAKHSYFVVLKEKHRNDYAVLCSTDAPQYQTCDVHVKYFDDLHQLTGDVPVNVDRKPYDYMHIVGAERLPGGICISVGLSKLRVNGDPTLRVLEASAAPSTVNGHAVGLVENGRTATTLDAAATYDNYLSVYYLPDDKKNILSQTIDVSPNVFPFYSSCTYNPFAGNINLLTLSYRDAIYRYGLQLLPTAITQNLFYKMDEHTLYPGYTPIENSKATLAKNSNGTTDAYQGLPIQYLTNENGLSTMVSQSYDRYNAIESKGRPYVFETYLGGIAVTQFDDDGRELWGTVLPLSQYYKSYRHYYQPFQLGKRSQDLALFNDMPPQVFERQFVSANTYTHGKDLYVVYNDIDKNFGDNTPGHHADTIYKYDDANACYYKITPKKEVTKHYVFGTPARNECKSSMVEGADFDEQRGVYASVIQYKRGDNTSLKMAWRTLE